MSAATSASSKRTSPKLAGVATFSASAPNSMATRIRWRSRARERSLEAAGYTSYTIGMTGKSKRMARSTTCPSSVRLCASFAPSKFSWMDTASAPSRSAVSISVTSSLRFGSTPPAVIPFR